MANAIKQISIARGHDVTRYTLQCFGGAGGQHACLVADALGIERVMIHPLAGVLSAYGMGLADMVESAAAHARRRRSRGGARRARRRSRGGAAARRASSAPEIRRRRALRYEGSDTALEVEVGPGMEAPSRRAHRTRFGFVSDAPVVVETAIVEAVGRGEVVLHRWGGDHRSWWRGLGGPSGTPRSTGLRAGSPDRTTALPPAQTIPGPAIIVDPPRPPSSSRAGRPRSTRSATSSSPAARPRETAPAMGTEVDPVMLEVMGNLFMAIAEEMGVALQNTASSVNIKERLDFSCAVFDREGSLIANAPHIPVHLGSMGDSIRTIIEARGERAATAAASCPATSMCSTRPIAAAPICPTSP